MEKNSFLDNLRYVLHSVKFKTGLYFFIMAVIILSVFFLSQTLYFSFYHTTVKTDEIHRVADRLVKEFPRAPGYNPEFKQNIQSTAMTIETNIIFFAADINISEDGESVELRLPISSIYESAGFGGQTFDIDEINSGGAYDTQFFVLAAKEEKFTYSRNLEGISLIVHGQKVGEANGGTTIYLYMSSPLSMNSLTQSVISRQTIFSTIICILVSLILSWFVSYRIASPITDFSKTAKKLAKGNYKVRFFGNGVSEIEDLATTLNYATEEIGKTEQLRRDLLANVSHDLRTPLTMVKAYAEMLRDFPAAALEKRNDNAQVIIDEADRLTTLVNDIQDLSKLQSGTESLEKNDFDLGQLVRTVTDRFDIYSEKGYIFESRIMDDCIIYADERKIEQVLYNLIGNAVNYTGEDKKIILFVKRSDGAVYFGVRDSGKGIAEDELDAVWDKYYRATQSKRKNIGTGLGLSIVKNILEVHSAKYGINSKVGEGSTFWFALPEAADVHRAEAEAELERQKKSEKRRSSKNGFKRL